jgi:hypothetical protein
MLKKAAFLSLSCLFLATTAPIHHAGAQDFDINAVFWCDPGKKTGEQSEAECTASRATILANCTNCHAITPIVKAQKTKQQWTAMMSQHRDRVEAVSEADIKKMTTFLQAHYNPQNTPPTLPPELEALGIPQ